MEKITARQLAMAYTGVFLGAGFVSGQELWQFFACFGPIGLLGFWGTAALFFYVNYANLRLIQVTGVEDMGRLMTWGKVNLLRSVVTFLQCLLLFGVTIIMIAGAASLLNQLLGIPPWIAGLGFTVLVSLIALLGLQGLVVVFSMLVPATTVVAVILAAAALIRGDFQFAAPNGGVSPLMPNWVVGFVTYAAYNLFGTISVLVPTAKLMEGEKTVRRGLGLGSGLLILLAWSIIAAMAVFPAVGLAELPMARLAGDLHPVLEAGYGILMGMGMFSACLAAITAVVNQIALRWRKAAVHHKPFTTILLLAAYGLSLLGFGNLIGVVYPVFGYASIPFLICLVRNWRKVRKTGSL